MENATKAFLIAGGVLIALITLSIFVFSYNQLNWYQNLENDAKDEQLIQKYNVEFEAFNKKIMYGTDIISVLNKAISHNDTKNAQYGNEYFINVVVSIEEINYGKGYDDTIKNKTYSLQQISSIEKDGLLKESSDSESIFYNFKKATFTCTGISYNDAGRISEIRFKQVMQNTQTIT